MAIYHDNRDDANKAMNALKTLADDGNVHAMYHFADLADLADLTMKTDYYHMAATKGHFGATIQVGGLYLEGRGVEKNPSTAAEWYKNAYDMAMDRGNPNDIASDAMDALKTLADDGNVDAMYYLATRLFENALIITIGENETLTMAVKYYRMAAMEGHCGATIQLGDLYLEGRGVEKNSSMAKEWYQKAYEKANEDCNFELAVDLLDHMTQNLENETPTPYFYTEQCCRM